MNSLETLTTFLGYCALINFGALLLYMLVIGVAHEFAGKLTAKIFGITKERVSPTFARK